MVGKLTSLVWWERVMFQGSRDPLNPYEKNIWSQGTSSLKEQQFLFYPLALGDGNKTGKKRKRSLQVQDFM